MSGFLKALGILLVTVLFMSCEKYQHVKPIPGPFEVTTNCLILFLQKEEIIR